MALTGTMPIKRAIVRRLRSSSELSAALVGGIHQRLAPRKIAYPFVVYDEVSAPFIHDWGSDTVGRGREIQALFDITVFATNAVEAENLGQQVHDLFDGADIEMTPLVGVQRVILCQVTGTLPDNGPERDDTGAYYARVGHTVEIRTEQPYSP